MTNKRIVVTGIGVLSSNGIGRSAFFDAVTSGVSGIKPVSLFDTSAFNPKSAGEIKDFVPEEFLGAKWLRTFDRSTKLLLSASKLALDDSGLVISEDNSCDTGMVIGTTLGSVASITDFDKEAIVEGPRYVNPALFPNTVINSPASQASIRFNIKGLNVTVSSGFCSSLDALNYAADFLRLGRAKVILAGGVEELCLQTFLGFYKRKCLSGSAPGEIELSAPFDRRRNGAVLGEGACLLVLESLDSARERAARIYAELLGFGTAFDAQAVDGYSRQGLGLRQAMRQAMDNSGVKPEDVGYISAAANSTRDADLIEAEAISDVFGKDVSGVKVSALKSMTGECFSASGALQLASALAAIDRQVVPPTLNYEQPDPACSPGRIANRPFPGKVDKVLINNFGPGGCNSSMLVARFKA